jgi:hypothetical protein
MDKQQIRVWFTDFWPRFIIDDNFFLNALKKKYDVVLDENAPDYLFYSMFGHNFIAYNCTKIFFSGENVAPDWKECDWGVSSFYINSERHYRLPIYYYMCGDIRQTTQPRPSSDEILASKTGFCNFVYSNPSCKMRNNFFHHLSQYKRVDSAGRHLNNMATNVDDKMEFLTHYKFTIAYENSEYDGYTTEKILEPFIANSIPIYWGNPLVYKDFNTKAFLNYYDFENEEALIKRIIEIDNDDELFKQYIEQPPFVGNKVNEYVDEDNLIAFLTKIVDTAIEPVSNRVYSKPSVIRNVLLCFKRMKFEKFFFIFRLKRFRLSRLINKLKGKYFWS